jgi:hypothetical protein
MPLTERKLRVFLCHASVDKPIVNNLYKSLNSEKWIEPWLDIAQLLPGQHWTTVIRQAIDSADIVIIFISNNSINREGFVQREMNFAWERSLEKPKNTIFLIPLRLEDCEVPYDLREKHWVDYFGERKTDTYQALLKSLKVRYEQVLEREATGFVKEEVTSEENTSKGDKPETKKTIIEPEKAINKVKPSTPNLFKGIFLTIVPGIVAIILAVTGFVIILIGPNIGITNMMVALALGPLLSFLTLAISGIGAFLALIKLFVSKNALVLGELFISAMIVLAMLFYQFYLWNSGDALITSLGYR